MARRRCPMLSFIFTLFLFGGWFYTLTVANHDSCRRLKFLQQKDGYGLVGHVFKNILLPVGMHIYSHCRNWCTMEDRCKSINMGPSEEKDKVLCQLSDSDHLQHPNDLKPMAGFMYRGTENKCCFNMCYNNATCLVGLTDKGYKCVCPAGYTGDHCEKDVNECSTKTHNCDVNAKCNNTEGSFNCSCKVGFNGDGKKCTDVDECTNNSHNCDVTAKCNNTEGSFNCSCKVGFNGDGKKCTDVDECTTNTHNCDVNANCKNTEGSFNCSCNVGFNGDGKKCTDINECATDSHNCGVHAHCNNTKGSFNCSCKEGFNGDGKNCTDVNECSTKTHNCDVNAECNNTEGSFNCSCKVGFYGDGKKCTDIDECSGDIHICGPNANCTNTNGSYGCSCHFGFTKSGKECVDIDECSVGVHSCLIGTATCINTIGSYNCSCNHDYVGDGRTSCNVQSLECQNPASLSNANRKETYSEVISECDNSLGPNWFRFQGAAGNKMAATCVPVYRCGASVTGWLNGTHPTMSEGIVTRQVCFHWSAECCHWSINIQVRNCNGYFVYNISGTPPEHPCHLRYCGAD